MTTSQITTVSPTPVYASELEHFKSPQEMALSQMTKVVSALVNIVVFGAKDSARVAAAKVLSEISSGKYEAARADKEKLVGQNIPDAWADRLRMFPPPNATRPNGQSYQAAA